MEMSKDLNQNMSIICTLLEKRQRDVESINRGNSLLKALRGN